MISEELIPPPPGMHYMMDGAIEGPLGIPDTHDLIWENNTIPEANLLEGRIFDLPTGGLPSPMFGAQDFDQQMLRFEEFGTDPLPPQPCRGLLVGGQSAGNTPRAAQADGDD